jgi:hypothetical protein
MHTTRYLDFDCVVLENAHLQLLVTRSVGPRIIGLNVPGRPNLLAGLPNATVTRPDGQVYHFYGGHRLWHAPEQMPRTYYPDDAPVEITPDQHGVLVTQPIELPSGLRKSLHIALSPDSPRLAVTHQLTNLGQWPIECAPWAITQFRTGGIAILPLSAQDSGLLPSRRLALWPYTDMSCPQAHWGRDFIWLESPMTASFKIGFSNPRGWLAYWLDDCLFVKFANYQPNDPYYDFGSSSECYCNDTFLELETLSPICQIQPGATVAHVETWQLFQDIAAPRTEADIKDLVAQLGLE